MQSKWPKHFRIAPTNPSQHKQYEMALKEVEMEAVVKMKRPFLTKCHRRKKMYFALSHKDWTMEDWKNVCWSDDTKISHLGSDGRQWVWKNDGEGLSDR